MVVKEAMNEEGKSVAVRYKGVVTVTHQLGNTLAGEHETENSYTTKAGAKKAAKKLGSEVECYYSPYHNMDYSAKVTEA